jgi:hypothetical protein
MKNFTLILIALALSLAGSAQQNTVKVDSRADGFRLMVDGREMMVNGMNWDYFPIGTNYSYSLWNQPDDFIKKALDDEMSLLRAMGVNAIRVYVGIPKKWIEYIYREYGIYTMLNHSFGRYGLTLDGAWLPNTDYSDPRVIELLLSETKALAEDYKNTPGLLMYLLGNENNYGLFWEGAETEDIPVQDRKSTQKANHLYKLFNQATKQMKSADNSHPVAICNGDLLFIDIIARECKDVDIYGTNMYRGVSFTDAFDRVKAEYNKPLLFTEFGADAYNDVAMQEDQAAQAKYLVSNWKEIYENAAGLGRAGNSIGGFTFQFSDGWWKTGQTLNLSVHDAAASWSNGGYLHDYVPGENNMSEEWFGICAKGPTDAMGHYALYPRAAYYALRDVHRFNPYGGMKTAQDVSNMASAISLSGAELSARGDKATLDATRNSKIRLSRFTADFTTFNTGGTMITTPDTPDPNATVFPSKLGFDHMQSFFIGVEANPASNMTGNVVFNVLGNVAQNPIDQIFYENRGRPVVVNTNNGNATLESINRIQVYQASYNWNHKMFNLRGFHRTGHYHWGYEGDFFGLYPEANYGPIIDTYNGLAPLGFELDGKKQLKNLKLAFGPQLWWGANPAILAKYSKEVAGATITGVFHEDLQQQQFTESSFAIPQPKTRRASLHAKRSFGRIGLDLGGLWGGQPLVGRDIQVVREVEGDLQAFQDEVKTSDMWGGKFKMTYTGGRLNWYASTAAMGLVANGSADNVMTFTGWRLKDSGSGNQVNFLSGFTYSLGKLQIAPNFLWQKPIEGPIPADLGGPARPRNILDDPFIVRANRETIGGELLFTFDPTPGTWMYEWDNDRSEDADFAVSAGVVYRHLPTIQDAAVGILGDGRSIFAFDGSAPAQDLWEAHARIVSKPNKDFGVIATLYAGNGQANGSDARLIQRYGMDVRVIAKTFKLQSFVRVNDWGPFDYHRDFNLTFPLQTMLDLSANLGRPDWFNMPGTRIGVRGTWRSLDQYSPRYAPAYTINAAGESVPDPTAIGFDNGSEWEVRVYVSINILN